MGRYQKMVIPFLQNDNRSINSENASRSRVIFERFHPDTAHYIRNLRSTGNRKLVTGQMTSCNEQRERVGFPVALYSGTPHSVRYTS